MCQTFSGAGDSAPNKPVWIPALLTCTFQFREISYLNVTFLIYEMKIARVATAEGCQKDRMVIRKGLTAPGSR